MGDPLIALTLHHRYSKVYPALIDALMRIHLNLAVHFEDKGFCL